MTNWNKDDYYKATYSGTGISLDQVNLSDEVINDIKKIENGFVPEHADDSLAKIYTEMIANLLKIKEEMFRKADNITNVPSPFLDKPDYEYINPDDIQWVNTNETGVDNEL